jgi:hypothetical protein
MSKRSTFEKIPKDFYPTTDPNAVAPLIPFIRGKTYAEPFYGSGDLEDLLMDAATCMWRSDIRPTGFHTRTMDALEITEEQVISCDLIISNPPFTKDVLLPCIDHLITLKPAWLLLPADMMHNRYFGPYMDMCDTVVSVGRVKWFPDSKHTSTDNFSWYCWHNDRIAITTFIGR